MQDSKNARVSETELDRIGARDAAREVFRARENAKRTRKNTWGFSTGGKHPAKRKPTESE